MALTSESADATTLRSVWVDDGRIMLIDQRRLPGELVCVDATRLDDMVKAIREMVVRGAPAIGVAAALGLAAHARLLAGTNPGKDEFLKGLDEARLLLQAARPTAINLSWATDLLFRLAVEQSDESLDALCARLQAAAETMIDDDIAVNRRIGEHGADLLRDGAAVLTHCNAGALATCGWGTALGVIRSAVRRGYRLTVYVDETRPRQQGSRLTAWELVQDDIVPTLITDNMAGYLMALGKVDAVIVGADRIAKNGDVANKIGTYSLAVLANAHGVPFYVAAPACTVDFAASSGADIPIEQRDANEVLFVGDTRVSCEGVKVFNPAFDVTPGRLVSGIITEKGIARFPYNESLRELSSESGQILR